MDDVYGDFKFQQIRESLPSLGDRPSLRNEPSLRDNKALLNTLLYALDYGQTSNISSRPDRYTETNPIMGEHPSQKDVNKYFASVMLTHALINALAPKKYKNLYNDIVVPVQGATVLSNQDLGLSLGRDK